MPDGVMSRRRFLGLVGFGFGTTSVGGMVGLSEADAASSLAAASSELELSYPENVVDAFLNVSAATPYLLGRSGWADVPTDEKVRTIRRLHAEKLDLHTNMGGSRKPPWAVAGGPTAVGGHFGEDAGLPTAGQQHLNVQLDQFDFWYRRLPDSERWTAPDGSVIEQGADFAARRFDGEVNRNERFGSAPPSLFYERYRDHMADSAIAWLEHGYSELYIDNATQPTWRGLDFSTWARDAFREHLASLPQGRREELGVDASREFDIVTYLEQEDLGPDEAATPFSDPVAREYKRFQLKAHRDYLTLIRQRIRKAFPERCAAGSISVVGNMGVGTSDPTPILLADVFDVVAGESTQTVPGKKVVDRSYKLGVAAGRFDRPVVSVGSMLASGGFATDYADLFDPARDYPTMLNLQVAEGFANGGMRSISLAGWGMEEDVAVDNWIRPDGSVPSALQSFLDFCWSHQSFLDGSVAANSTAVVYSLPTAIWQRAPQWDSRDPDHADAFEGLCALCRRQQVPYDVLVFGIPDVWDDDDQLDRLREYDTIVLPSVSGVSDSQVETIRTALDTGTQVVLTDGPPTQDADRQPRSDLESLVDDHENATVVDSSPGIAVANDRTPENDLAVPLNQAGRQVRLDAEGVVPSVRRQPDAERTLVHLVNYAYDRQSDSVEHYQDVDVSIFLPDVDASAVHWITTSGRVELDPERSGDAVQVTIPSLDVYGFLAVGADASALTLGERSAAEEAIGLAESAVQAAEDEGRTTLGLTRARAEFDNARVALDHRAFDSAERAATRAVEEAGAAVEPPVIGIDQAHDQSAGDFTWDAFETLRSRFDRYTYERVTSWSGEALSALDLLVIPPIQHESEAFEAAERELLDAYLDDGGRVVVLEHPDSSGAMTTLTERYGFGFDGDPIIQLEPVFTKAPGEGITPRQFDARTTPSRLTQYALSFRTINATPVTITDDAVVELGFVNEHSNAFVNRDGPEDERADADESAAGLPFIAARSVGAGFVAGIGTPEHFLEPTQGEDGGRGGLQDDPLVTALLRTAAAPSDDSASQHTTATSSPTSNSTTSTESGQQPTADTTSESTPGFGITSTLGGLAGAAAVYRWLGTEDK